MRRKLGAVLVLASFVGVSACDANDEPEDSFEATEQPGTSVAPDYGPTQTPMTTPGMGSTTPGMTPGMPGDTLTPVTPLDTGVGARPTPPSTTTP